MAEAQNAPPGCAKEESRGIRFGLGRKIVLTVALALIISDVALIASQSRAMLQSKKSIYASAQSDLTEVYARQIGGAVRFGRIENITDASALGGLLAKNYASAILVQRSTGETLFQLTESPAIDAEMARAADAATAGAPVDLALSQTRFLSAHSVPFGAEDESVGTLVVVWDQSAAWASMMQKIATTGIIALLFGISVMVGLALLLGRWLSRPLARTTKTIEQISDGSYDLEVTDQARGDEIGAIGRCLDRLRQKLLDGEAAASRAKDLQVTQEALTDHVNAGLAQLAAGDFTARIDLDHKDLAGLDSGQRSMCADFNNVAESIGGVIGAVEQSADAVSRGSSEIAQMAQDLSKRSETQAATLEESAAALDQLTASVKSAAGKASEADNATEENRRRAEASGEVVQAAVTAMRQIEEGSSQITQIIGVIDDIAFQTNLLALNAGVEAARAGEAGRGFAVVASEVRALAQRASESAREIKGLISKSAAQVEEGGQLVGRTGTALEEIVAKVAQVSDLVSDIAASAKEQAAGLQEINTGVNQLDQVTQQNAAVVEEATAASQQLSDEARRLTAVLAGLRGGSGAEAAGGGEVVTMDVRRPAEAGGSAPKKRAAAGGGDSTTAPSSSDWEEF